MQQAVQHAAADARHAVKPDAARQPEGPARANLPADLEGVAARRSRPLVTPGLAIRWTSTRKLREPTIGSASSARRGCRLRAMLARRVAAHQRQRGGAGDEPGGGQRRRPGRRAASPASATGRRAPRPAPARPPRSPRRRPERRGLPRRRRRRSARTRSAWTRGGTSAAYGDSVRGQVQSREPPSTARPAVSDYLWSDVDIDRRLRQGARARADRSTQGGPRPRRPPLLPYARGPHAARGGDGGPQPDHARLQQLPGADRRRARQAGRARRAEPVRHGHHRVALPQRDARPAPRARARAGRLAGHRRGARLHHRPPGQRGRAGDDPRARATPSSRTPATTPRSWTG